MDAEWSYDLGDIGNIAAQGRTRAEINRQTQALRTEFKNLQDAQREATRQQDELIRLQRSQMEAQEREIQLRKQQETIQKAYRKEMVALSTVLAEVRKTHHLP